ncbi:MAG: hypothetical protein WDN26_06985 [Chitinophagaceae bacterium]
MDIKRVCIHECCHAVVARLFRQRMTIEKLVMDVDLIEKDQDLGTLHVNGPRLSDEQDYTALAITLFAGVVGENVYLLGTDGIREKKEEIIADNTIMDWLSAGGDISSFSDTAFAFRLCYQIDVYKLKEFCLRFLIDFLSNREVWSMVEKLYDELLKSNDLKLHKEELESAFRQIRLDELLDSKRKECLKQCDEVLQFCQGMSHCL